MGVNSLFGMIVLIFYFTSVVSEEDVKTCDFLTFGQDKAATYGLNPHSCPNIKDNTNTHCCYTLLRKPYCCNNFEFLSNGFLWFTTVLMIIGGIAKLVKLLLAFC